jgi:hypothetical protein
MANGTTMPATTTAAPIRYVSRRSLPNVVYQAGVRNTIQIDRDGVLSALNIRAQFSILGGATTATPLFNALARIFRRIEVVVDGQDTTISVSGAMLAARQQIESGARAFGMDATVVTTNGVTTAYDIILRIPFYQPRAVRPDDTSLDLRRVTQAILAVTWGDINDIFGTVGGASISVPPVCTVEAEYLINDDPAKVYMTRVLDEMQVPITATNPRLNSLMDRGQDLFYRTFLTATTRDNVAVNDILDAGTQQLLAGSVTYINRNGVNVRADQATYFGIPVAERATGLYPFWLPYLEQNTTLINTGMLTADLYFYNAVVRTSGVEFMIISREAMRPLRT